MEEKWWIDEKEKSKRLLKEMNSLYEGYKSCRDTGEYFSADTCIGKVMFEKINSDGEVSVYIRPKEEKAYDKIKRLADENCRLRHALLVISGNDAAYGPEMLGKIARDALYFRDAKTDGCVIQK